MVEKDCPDCETTLHLIEPMTADHHGTTYCDNCNARKFWKSPAGTRTIFWFDELDAEI